MAVPALAVIPGEVRRIDNEQVEITWQDDDPVTIYLTKDPSSGPEKADRIAQAVKGGRRVIKAPSSERNYFILQDGGDQSTTVLGERVLPLQQGSNFRDIGGYVGADGRRVKWGKVYRSGAMPLLTEADHALLDQLGLGTIVDLRSTDERQIAPDDLDDWTLALFVSNDYSLKKLMAGMTATDGEYLYRGIGKSLAPQFRSIFKRLLADEGAVLYHCSAGQDRTGVATALIYSALGVPRETIVRDYHLSTALRRPQFEMPPIDPADWPGNPIIPYYVATQKNPGGAKAEPLFTRKGISHLVQFFETIDQEYGSVAGYLETELGVTKADLAKLQSMYLE
jgi:protein-tyrosine phosphatase